MNALRFLIYSAAGLFFFALPVPADNRMTVPFEMVVKWILGSAQDGVGLYCLVLIVVGAIGSLAAFKTHPKREAGILEHYRTSMPLILVRLTAVPLAFIYFLRVGPEFLLQICFGKYLCGRPSSSRYF